MLWDTPMARNKAEPRTADAPGTQNPFGIPHREKKSVLGNGVNTPARKPIMGTKSTVQKKRSVAVTFNETSFPNEASRIDA